MELLFNEIFKALGYLLIAGVVLFAWKMARDNARNWKLKNVLWKGFLWCAAIALFGSLILGNPSCEEQTDPIRGGCEQYADDGFSPTTEQRIASFAYLMTLFYIPVVVGAFNGSKLEPKSFFSDVKTEDVPKYQEFFLEMLEYSDVENLTKRSQGMEYSRITYNKSYENLEPILDRAEKEGLVPTNLQIMFEQYVFADVIQREIHKNHWVEKVLNREDEDFFPDPKAILELLRK